MSSSLPARLRRKVKRTARRLGGLATSGDRALPDWLIVGTQRGGTTALHGYLCEHPAVVRPAVKEIHYFDRNLERGPDWYRAHFPRTADLAGGKVTGEATPMLFHPHAARLLADLVPDARLIALLRNPVERAHSAWKLQTEAGAESLDFAEAIRSEAERTGPGRERVIADPAFVDDAYLRFNYLERGRYAEHLERWMASFPAEQILVVKSEDLFERPESVYPLVVRFLGLAEAPMPGFKRANASGRSAIDPETRAWLVDHYAAHNERLEQLLERSFDWS